jgi:mRNA interferase MazF
VILEILRRRLPDLDPTRGREIAKTRPVVVVSLDVMNRYLDTVVVIRTVSKERLGRRVDRLAPSLATQLRQLITEMYGE